MIQLLYAVITAEASLILILLFKTPLRKLAIMVIDHLKRGRGPVMIKTVAATVFVVLLSSLYSISDIQARTVEGGFSNPTDEVLMAQNMLEASLMGFVLFLSLMIDRLHHYIRELRLLRKTMEAVKKQDRSSKDSNDGGSEQLKTLRNEIAALQAKVKRLQSESEVKGTEAKAA